MINSNDIVDPNNNSINIDNISDPDNVTINIKNNINPNNIDTNNVSIIVSINNVIDIGGNNVNNNIDNNVITDISDSTATQCYLHPGACSTRCPTSTRWW